MRPQCCLVLVCKTRKLLFQEAPQNVNLSSSVYVQSIQPNHAMLCHTMTYKGTPYNLCNAIRRHTMKHHAYHAMQQHAAPFHAMQCHTLQRHSLLCNALQYNTTPCNIMSCHGIPCHLISCLAMQHQATPCHTMQRHTAISAGLG